MLPKGVAAMTNNVIEFVKSIEIDNEEVSAKLVELSYQVRICGAVSEDLINEILNLVINIAS